MLPLYSALPAGLSGIGEEVRSGKTPCSLDAQYQCLV